MRPAPERPGWQILTGEYAPDPGGVGDYTRLVAEGLAALGAEVQVWAPPSRSGDAGGDVASPGVTVRREAGRWSAADLARVGRGIDRAPAPRRILVQFAPNMYGYRGMNPHLGGWLAGRRRRGDHIRVMFHEVMYVVKPGDGAGRRALARVQRHLAGWILAAADAVDVSVPAWERLLRPADPAVGRAYHWRPVPSNIPVVDDPGAVAAIRARYAPAVAGSALIGSFGTFADDVAAMVAGAVLPLLEGRPDRAALLIGRGGERTAERWLRDRPGLAGRVHATGARGPDDVSRHLQACDVLVQPYPGGVCTKRGSLMAGIAHGLPVVTTVGEVTEPFWEGSGAVAMAPEGDAPALAALAESLLADPGARARLGDAARALYEARCDVSHTVAALAGVARPGPAEAAIP